MLRRLLDRRRCAPLSVVHIGFHKTGSTSLQHFLGLHRAKLHEHGIAFYEGAPNRNNHVELHVAAMREDRASPFKLHSGLNGGKIYWAEVRRRIREYADAHPQRTLLFSAEGLSLLRHNDEMLRLKALLPGPVRIITYLRDPRDYLKSYVAQLNKMNVALDLTNEDSHAYVSEGTWLADYEGRLDAFRKGFGAVNVISIDYDLEVTRHGSVIPSFLDFLECRHLFAKKDWAGISLNPREPVQATQTDAFPSTQP